MRSSPASPVPVGMLVIYDPGFKFKYKKYYVRKGVNTIGAHPNCHIVIAEGQRLPDKAAQLTVTDDLVTLEPLALGAVHVLSNVSKKTNTMVQIGPGLSYVVELEKDFLICGRKSLLQITPLSELLQVKGVVNEALFDLRGEGDKDKSKSIPVSQFEPTVPLEQFNFQPTVRIDDDYQFEATQKLEDQAENGFQPTIPLDREPYLPAQASKQDGKASGQLIQRVESQMEVDMPETIRENSMPATIKEDNLEDAFPPTIQESQSQSLKQKEKEKERERLEGIRKKVTNMTKSQPAYRQMQASKTEKAFHSLDEKKEKLVDSFEDLFGGINNLEQSNKTISLKSNNSKQGGKREMKETNSDAASDRTQKVQSDHENGHHNKSIKKGGLSQIKQANQESQKSTIQKYSVCGKVNKLTIDNLKKRGYQFIDPEEAEGAEFQLLLVEGELKWSKLLVLSLIKGREIRPVSWVSNPLAKLTGKLEGFLWENIDKRKGKGTAIFGNGKLYYLQEELREEYEGLLEAAGASLVEKVSKGKSKQAIQLIVEEKSREGREVYEEWRNYKNWGFFSRRMLVESLLMGEEIADKYRLDSYSF